MTLNELIAQLDELKRIHGGDVLVTVNCNGYDSEPCECSGADYNSSAKCRDLTIPENISISSGEPWDEVRDGLANVVPVVWA
mgnify:CR=1 FL=1